MKIPKIKSDKGNDNVLININHIEEPNKENMYVNVDEINEKLIKRIEKLVRNSFEYREYIQFLKDELDMNYCSFFSNLSWDDVSIDMHHSVFTLFDIVYTIVMYYVSLKKPFTVFDVANKVMYLHYECRVALMPLSKTVHELYHNTGEIFIPCHYSFGDYESFYKEYNQYMTDMMKDKYEELVKLSKEYKDSTPEILTRKYTYIKCDGMELPKKIDRANRTEVRSEITVQSVKNFSAINNK